MNLKVIRNNTHDATGIFFKPIQHSHAADERAPLILTDCGVFFVPDMNNAFVSIN